MVAHHSIAVSIIVVGRILLMRIHLRLKRHWITSASIELRGIESIVARHHWRVLWRMEASHSHLRLVLVLVKPLAGRIFLV
jgi:hypothetical protein